MAVDEVRAAAKASGRADRNRINAALKPSPHRYYWVRVLIVGSIAVVLLLLLAVLSRAQLSAFPDWAPRDSQASFFTMWQVEGAALGVAFPLLLLFAQLVQGPAILAAKAT